MQLFCTNFMGVSSYAILVKYLKYLTHVFIQKQMQVRISGSSGSTNINGKSMFDRNICALHIKRSFNMRCTGSVFDETNENEELGRSVIIRKIDVATGQESKDEKNTLSCKYYQEKWDIHK